MSSGWKPLSEGATPAPPKKQSRITAGRAVGCAVLTTVGLYGAMFAGMGWWMWSDPDAAVVIGSDEFQGVSADAEVKRPRQEGPFLVAKIELFPLKRPARFDADPPAWGEPWTEAHPPPGWFKGRVGAGSPAAWARWLAGRDADPSAEAAQHWGFLLGDLTPAVCDRVQALAGRPNLASAMDARGDEPCEVRALDPGDAEVTRVDRPKLALLHQLGLLPASIVSKPLFVEEALVEAGLADSFDAETDQYPNEHDERLARWGVFAGGSLADVLWWEVPPADAPILRTADGQPRVAGQAGPAVYMLHAWHDGIHYWTPAADLGDWYDLDVALGFFNAVAAAIDSPSRALGLPGDGQYVGVLVADGGPIEEGVASGALTVGGAGSEEARAGEAGLLRRIQAGELLLPPPPPESEPSTAPTE